MTTWTDSFLDEMRERADPLADDAIHILHTSDDRDAVRKVLDNLQRNEQIKTDSMPGCIRDYFNLLPHVPEPELPLIHEGQELFETYGPEILMILGCYSLPAAYAARKGVQVLYRTGYLEERTNLRLFQTSQMVIDVMSPEGLGPTGMGRVTAMKVRLIHAAIRHLLLSDTKNPWPDEWGVPLNQEDLAGTLMTFTHLIRDGLDKLGIGIWPPGYLNCWQVVGRMLGIVEELIPKTPDEAAELCATIQRRQVDPSPEGRALTKALLEMMQHFTPPLMGGMPAALMRLFLPPDVADGLEIPVHKIDEEIIKGVIGLEKFLHPDAPADLKRAHFRRFATHIVELLVSAELGWRRPQFRIPTHLQDAWQMSKN